MEQTWKNYGTFLSYKLVQENDLRFYFYEIAIGHHIYVKKRWIRMWSYSTGLPSYQQTNGTFNTGASDVMRNNSTDILDFLADVHTLSKVILHVYTV